MAMLGLQVWAAVQVVDIFQADGVCIGAGDSKDDSGEGGAVVRGGLPHELRHVAGALQWIEPAGRELEAAEKVCGEHHHARGSVEGAHGGC